ncbi:MAG: DNA polymerase III subunit gamma/tau [Peptoniphilus sp.]|nr:DNA polymerase III subunit gamma/tau [Peptoniphilus sp.]MDY6044589.1 DNA polymerase III subunit gamma/tau [Peptoniphilus sp.]
MQALYRRYRPKTFEDVVGQETTITALKNQIREDRIHHAYIFSGTRGTGKTSVAKIFARAVNCLHPVDASPCNTCDVCRGILDETLFDVMEIDAASNNSVDDIREIRENVAYPPAMARKKVYIIDEVHMLSKGAFNALLKMLEEPPSHALFILATTEPEKIPATILSRSQHFTFLRLRDEEIKGELADILEKEGRAFTDDALSMIAAHSDGSMRDALSILDQMMSFSEDMIDGEVVRESLGLTDHEGIFRIVDGILARDPVPMMDAIELAYRHGKNFQLLLDSLITYFRDLLFYRYAEEVPSRFTEGEGETFVDQAKAMPESLAFDCIDVLQKGRENFKYTRHAKTAVEILLLKTLHLQDVEISREVGAPVAPREEHPRERPKKREVARNDDAARTDGEASRKTPKKETPAEASPLSDEGDHAIIKDDTVDEETWQAFISKVQTKSVACAALLKDAARTSMNNQTLCIMYEPSFGFHLKMLKTDDNRRVLDEAVRDALGDGWSVVVKENEEADDPVLESMKRVFKDTPIETD